MEDIIAQRILKETNHIVLVIPSRIDHPEGPEAPLRVWIAVEVDRVAIAGTVATLTDLPSHTFPK